MLVLYVAHSRHNLYIIKFENRSMEKDICKHDTKKKVDMTVLMSDREVKKILRKSKCMMSILALDIYVFFPFPSILCNKGSEPGLLFLLHQSPMLG